MKRAALVLFMLLATWFLSGCSLVGLGIGAASPTTELRVVEEEAAQAEPGETVRLQMKSGEQLTGTVSASQTGSVEIVPTQQQQTYENGYAVLVSQAASPQPVTVPAAEIQRVVVQKAEWIKKSHALKGFLIGLAIDAALATVGAIAWGVSQQHPTHTASHGGQSSCFISCDGWFGNY